MFRAIYMLAIDVLDALLAERCGERSLRRPEGAGRWGIIT